MWSPAWQRLPKAGPPGPRAARASGLPGAAVGRRPPGLKNLQSTALVSREGEQEQRKGTVSPSDSSREQTCKRKMNQGHGQAAEVSASVGEPSPALGQQGQGTQVAVTHWRLGPRAPALPPGSGGHVPEARPPAKGAGRAARIRSPPPPAADGPAAALPGTGGGLRLEGIRESPEDTDGPPSSHLDQTAAAASWPCPWEGRPHAS